jgi:4-aminobutyrate aminotransferase/(S)-3-amino-2-methylpropionate transaminase
MSTSSVTPGAFDMQSIYRALVVDDEQSRGCYLKDIEGNQYLDLFSSFALGALGYNHPRLLATVKSEAFQRASINPTTSPFIPAKTWLDCVDRIASRYAPKNAAKMFCVDGGGEGVEAALKAAFIVHGETRREREGRPKNPLDLAPAELQAIVDNQKGSDAVVLSFHGGFHGRGLGSLSATHSKAMHKADLPCFPWPSVPFPGNRFPLEQFAEDNARLEEESLQAVERVLDANADKVAAILVEPIQGEGGDRHASPSFFQKLQFLAAKASAALIFDEVQTGVGITGTLWCHEQFDLPNPIDLMTFGKKMQMGGFFANARYDIRQFGRMYQTRNGDRARALLGLAILDTIAEDNLLANVRTQGALFLRELEALAAKHPKLVTEPRGRGLFLAFDLPTTASRDDFLVRARKRGVFATYTGTRSVRLRPHLICEQTQVEEAMRVFHAVAGELDP